MGTEGEQSFVFFFPARRFTWACGKLVMQVVVFV